MFKQATRTKAKARIALDGPAGSGKTFTALRAAFALAGPNGRVAVVDTEGESASKYVGLAPDGIPWQFSVATLPDNSPTSYTTAINEAARLGFDVLILDSLSHAWSGVGGALEQVDKKSTATRGNSFSAWKDVTPMHNRMVDAILRSPIHIIATLRTQTEYVLEEFINDQGQKKTRPTKVGMKPVQRAGIEYEFDLVCDLDQEHLLTVSKSRCPEIDGRQVLKPGALFFEEFGRWLAQGTDPQVAAVAYQATDEDRAALLARQEKEARKAEAKANEGKSAQDILEEKRAAKAKAESIPGDAGKHGGEAPKRTSAAAASVQGSASPLPSPASTAAVGDASTNGTANIDTAKINSEMPGTSLVEQIERIRYFANRLGIDAATQARWLETRKCNAWRNLSYSQAAELESKLESLVEAQTAEDLGFSDSPAYQQDVARRQQKAAQQAAGTASGN